MNKSICTIDAIGNKRWYINGKLNRENDLPAIEYSNGDKAWYLDDKHHREGDKPAIEWVDGYKAWRFNDKRHRTTGAAIEWANGTKEWWVNGKKIDCRTQKEFEYFLKWRLFL